MGVFKSKWFTADGLRKNRLRRSLTVEPELLDDNAVMKLAEIGSARERLYYKLMGVQLILVGYLLASIYQLPLAITILNNTITSKLPLQEVALLISAVLGIVSWSAARQGAYINAIINAYIEVKHPQSAELVRGIYANSVIQIAPMEGTAKDPTSGAIRAGVLVVGALGFVVGALCLVAVAISVHVLILWSLWHHPELPVLFNRLIVIGVAGLDLFSFSMLVFEHVPLPSRVART